MKKILTTTFILLTLIIAACDNGGDCNINNVSLYRTLFYGINAETGEEERYQFTEQVSVSLMVNGTDSIVVNQLTAATELALPMCYTQETDTVILQFGTITNDTLFVEHTNIPYFISMDCGTGMYHNLKAVRHTTNFIDSARIVYPFINFDAHENIKLYIAQ
ncbi:MAG: hypothetical protein IJN24_04315 [Bacteroidaceae bacterium]|nr:hypothetical protein [Bacteroidaceae bacterium]